MSAVLLSPRFQALMLILCVALLLALAILYLFFAEPARDEFCRAALGTAPGAIGDYVLEAYGTATGRWLAMAFYAAILPRLDLFGLDYSLVLLLLMLAWFAGIWLALDLIFGRTTRRRFLLLFAMLVFAIVWAGAPSLEGFYWLTGAAEYGLQFLLMMLAFHVGSRLDDPKSGWPRAVAAGLLAILAAGLHELAGIVLVGVLAAWLAILWHQGRRRAFRHVLIFLLLAAIGLAVSVAAPGNAARADIFTESGNVSLALALTARPWSGPIAWLADLRLVAVSLLLLALPRFRALRPRWTHTGFPPGWLIPAAVVVAIVTLALIVSLAQGYGLAPRTMTWLYALLVLGWIASLVAISAALDLGGDDNLGLRRLRAAAVPLLALALITAPATGGALRDLPKLSRWRQENRAVQQHIVAELAAGRHDVLVPRISAPPVHYSGNWLTPDPDWWPNRCMAAYVGARSLRLEGGGQ